MESFMEHMLILDEEKNKWTKRTRDMSALGAFGRKTSTGNAAKNVLRHRGYPQTHKSPDFIYQGKGEDRHRAIHDGWENQYKRYEQKEKQYNQEDYNKNRRMIAAGGSRRHTNIDLYKNPTLSYLPKPKSRLLNLNK